jgi:protein involved in polysaccharide export with SLBB domain
MSTSQALAQSSPQDLTDEQLRQKIINEFYGDSRPGAGQNNPNAQTQGGYPPPDQGQNQPNGAMQAPGPSRPGAKVLPTGGDLLISPEKTPTTPGATFDSELANAKPFGWQLFSEGLPSSRAQSINPNYVISPGDKIAVQIWGPGLSPSQSGSGEDSDRSEPGTALGTQPAGLVVTVDLQGNIFLPELGPIRVAGLTNEALNKRITEAFARIFTTDVQIYTNLLSAQPVGIYVTGAVVRPGRFAGDRSDSALYFLGQAGGVDLKRGSFRDLSVMRGNKRIATIDLYAFLLTGQMPVIDFRDNDTIVVGPQKPTVIVSGDVHNTYQFEIGRPVATGADIITLAQPFPKVTHVAQRGFRNGQPFDSYLTLDEFRQARVQDGDAMLFQSDLVNETIFVTVTGQSAGPSAFAVPRGTHLKQLLDMVPIDPTTADVSSIYLRRKSTAERQKRALELSLDQLERTVLTATSQTPSEAQIRGPEAQLVSEFIAHARSVEPEGRVVLAGQGGVIDIQLEADDAIVIPPKSDVVIVSGEVQIPQNLVFVQGKPASYYIGGSGGFTERADHSNLLIARQNGMILTGSSVPIQPGDHIMVMPEIDTKGFAILSDIVEVLYRVAISTGVVLAIM